MRSEKTNSYLIQKYKDVRDKNLEQLIQSLAEDNIQFGKFEKGLIRRMTDRYSDTEILESIENSLKAHNKNFILQNELEDIYNYCLKLSSTYL